MSSPKDIRRYTDKWLEVFDWMEANPEKPYEVDAGTDKRARTLRFEFYRARSAVENDKGLRALYTNLDRREVIIDGTKVTIRYKEATPIAQLLAKGLENVTGKEAK